MIGANQCPHGSLRRSCEICDLAEDCKTLERECERLRAINAELVTALETTVGCMKLQRDVIERGAHSAAWEHPIRAAESVLARAKGQS